MQRVYAYMCDHVLSANGDLCLLTEYEMLYDSLSII